MTFIKEITPHIERIRLHKEGGRITSIEILREIRDIHFTHIRSNDFDIPTNLGCGSCVAHMINQLVGKIDRELKHTVNIEEALPELNKVLDECWAKQEAKGKKMTFPKQEPKDVVWTKADDIESRGLVEEIEGSLEIKQDPFKLVEDNCRHSLDSTETIGEHKARVKAMKWGAFKKYCTSKGLKVPKKTRKMLEEELKGL